MLNKGINYICDDGNTHSDVEPMNPAFYHKLCITNILKGVEEGLSKYSSVSRVALIFVPNENDPIRIFDPQNILRGRDLCKTRIFSRVITCG